jgi:opacity protein-like surface antigen
MKRTLALFAAGTALAAAPALAGTIEQPEPDATVTEPPRTRSLDFSPDWTGFYGGAQLGYAGVESIGPGGDDDAFVGGLTGGYDHDFGQWVLGGALDIDWTDAEVSPATDIDNVFRAKLRGGYKIGKGLLYATGGYAKFELGGPGDDDGYVVGGGYEYMVRDNLSVGGEVLYHEVEDFNAANDDLEATTVQIRATYRF